MLGIFYIILMDNQAERVIFIAPTQAKHSTNAVAEIVAQLAGTMRYQNKPGVTGKARKTRKSATKRDMALFAGTAEAVLQNRCTTTVLTRHFQ